MRLIDADALKQRIREKFDGLIERIEINSVINAQPTVDVPQWIPCSERLPEAPTFCLVTTDGSYNDVIDIAMYMSDGWHKASKVLAWMPLPEPWEGEADGRIY